MKYVDISIQICGFFHVCFRRFPEGLFVADVFGGRGVHILYLRFDDSYFIFDLFEHAFKVINVTIHYC